MASPRHATYSPRRLDRGRSPRLALPPPRLGDKAVVARLALTL
nr:unnamed protein product [Digitaria exilis]